MNACTFGRHPRCTTLLRQPVQSGSFFGVPSGVAALRCVLRCVLGLSGSRLSGNRDVGGESGCGLHARAA